MFQLLFVYVIVFGLAVGVGLFVLQPLFAVASSVLCRMLRLCWVDVTVPVCGVQAGDVATSQCFETDRTWRNKLQLLQLQ